MNKKLSFSEIDFSNPFQMQGMYNYATSIFYSNPQEARRIFHRILRYKDVSAVHSGCYISLARMLLNSHISNVLKGHRNKTIEAELISLIENSLEVKPTNTAAHGLMAEFYMLVGEFENALEQLNKIPTEHGIISLEHNLCLHLELISQQVKKGKLSKEVYLGEDAKEFYLAFLNQNKKTVNDTAFCKIIECFLDGTRINALFALDILKIAEAKLPESLNIVHAACNIYSVGIYQFPEKLLEYALKKKRLIEKTDAEISEEIRDSTFTHLGQAYVGLKRYDDAIEILEPRANKKSKNVDLHNLANAYYNTQNYELAAKYAKRALYTVEDETTLHLLACIFHEQANHKEAIKYFERELHFRKNAEAFIQTIEENGDPMFSNLAEEDDEPVYERLYLSFISSLYQEKEYIKAKIILEEALQDYPNNRNIKSWESILDNVFSQEEVLKTYQEELNCQKRQYFEVRANYEKIMNTYHTWAEKLFELQNKVFNEETLEKDMETIIEILKSESGFSDKKVKHIKSNIEKNFPYLDQKSKVFLVTAEYLYSSNQYAMMDFAPIVVEYSKVLENELNKHLKLKSKCTLGQLVYYIRENKVPHFFDYLSEINQILVWRNGSAHTSTSTIEVVEHIRETYYDKDLLKRLFVDNN